MSIFFLLYMRYDQNILSHVAGIKWQDSPVLINCGETACSFQIKGTGIE
jgi:hypothetical protein